jgi:hypothetical protein
VQIIAPQEQPDHPQPQFRPGVQDTNVGPRARTTSHVLQLMNEFEALEAQSQAGNIVPPGGFEGASVRAETSTGIGAPEIGAPTLRPPEIPEQGYGPHFEIGDDGIITFATPGALDRQGNNVARLKKLHPSLRTLSSDLVEALGRGNIPHWHLRDRADAYRAMIDQNLEQIDFSLPYVEGVRLANAEKATVGERELPSLAPPVREALDTLLQVHGTFMLATAEGVEAIAAEERYGRTPLEEIEYLAAMVGVAQSLQNKPQIINPKAAEFVLETAHEIGRGPNLERSGTVATGTVKNVSIIVLTAASLAALSVGAAAAGFTALSVGSAVASSLRV